jgi:hypothetical protein
MHRTERKNPTRAPARLALLLCAGVLALAAPVAATDAVRDSGEPTDPEKMLVLIELSDIDLDDHGISSSAPSSTSAVDSWLEAVLDLLRSLGVLAAEDSAP